MAQHLTRRPALYGRITTGTAAGGTLAFTGLNVGWLALAAVTLIAAGAALWRLAPRRED
jgi:hypothetical protein